MVASFLLKMNIYTGYNLNNNLNGLRNKKKTKTRKW